MRYQKKLSMPRAWPISKKAGSTYIISAIGKKKSESLALVILLRDILKIAATKKEVKRILRNKEVLINGKSVIDEKYPVGLLDIMAIPKLNQYYRIIFENNKLKLSEISEKESNERIVKIVNKKQLAKNKTQINLYGGGNLIYDGKVSTHDSVIIDLKQNKIIKILPLKQNSKVLILFGKHSGKTGEIKETINQGKLQEAIIKNKNQEIRIPIENILVVQ